jgi:hypothetical protein
MVASAMFGYAPVPFCLDGRQVWTASTEVEAQNMQRCQEMLECQRQIKIWKGKLD